MNVTEIIQGTVLSKTQAMELLEWNLEELTAAANRIRRHFCGDFVDLCAIVNAKSGCCSENCRYCAQSCFHHVTLDEYPLCSAEQIVQAGRYNAQKGVLRFSVVTSGRKLSTSEIDVLCTAFELLRKECSISICASLGLLTEKELKRLKNAGLTRYHHNLETSRRFFPEICTTHTYDEKLETIANAQSTGLEVCCGGILGLGETMEDRVDMVLELRRLGIHSIPVNVLNPIPGTPLESNPILTSDEVRQTIAIFRFILPQAVIRLAGGRGLFADKGKSFLLAGANAAITGDMLTTSGISIQEDIQMCGRLNLKVQKI